MQKNAILMLVFLFIGQLSAQIDFEQKFVNLADPIGWTSMGTKYISNGDACDVFSIRFNLKSSTPSAQFISPNFENISNGTDITFKFDYKIEKAYGTIPMTLGFGSSQLQYSTDDGYSWVNFYTIDDTNHVVSNQCVTITQIIPGNAVPAGSDFKIRFVHSHLSDNWDIYLDNITARQEATTIPDCVTLSTPVDQAVSVVNSVISWPVAVGIPAGYKLKVGSTPGGTDILNMFDVGYVTSYDLGSPLNVGTQYYVTVIPYNSFGDAVGCSETMFTTCGAVITAPYTQNFSNSGSIPDCWTMSGGEPWKFTSYPQGQIGNQGSVMGSTPSGGHFAWVDDSGTPTNDVSLTSPEIDITGLSIPRIVFYEISDNQGATNATLNVELYDGVNWSTIGTYNTNTVGWCKRVIDLSTLSITSAIRVRFVILGSTSEYDDIAIDDFTIEETPSCVEPANFAFNNLTNTTVDLSWIDASILGQFDYEYVVQPQGAGVPVGSGVMVTDATSVTVGITTPLNQDTLYEAWIRAYCGGTDYSDWVGPVYFRTHCNISVAPYTYDVETAVTASPIDDCWSASPVLSNMFVWKSATTVSSSTTGPSVAHSGSKFFHVESSFGANEEAVLYSTLIDISGLVNPSLEFWYHMFGNAASMGSLYVDVFDGTTWVNIDQISGVQQMAKSDPWLLRQIVLAGYSNTIQVRFRATKNGSSGDIALDDIALIEGQSLGNSMFVNDSFKAYPNPVEDTLNLEYNTEITNIKVFNLPGQVVINENINAISAKLDMSQLISGVYMVNITIGDSVKTVKVVKQ
jgi:hypothetical protein